MKQALKKEKAKKQREMICGRCGNPIIPNTKICPYCNYNLTRPGRKATNA